MRKDGFDEEYNRVRIIVASTAARKCVGLTAATVLVVSLAFSGLLNANDNPSISAAAAKDTTKPQLSIYSPVAGATITGTGPEISVIVKGTAFDPGSGIEKVWVRVDRGTFSPAIPKTANDWSSWSISLKIPAGSHDITAKARDNSGNEKWRIISVSVKQEGVTTPPPADGIPPPIRILSVSSINGLMNAAASARPGDHIILKNGIYDNSNWLNSRSAKNMLIRGIDGTSTAPIVISAETIGGAEIRGIGGFRFLDVSHLAIRGFKFTHSQDNSAASDDTAIQCDLCKHVRFTRNHFELTTSASLHSDWLSISSDQSDYNRIDQNSFKNKKTKGVFVLVFGKHTTVDHNYFYNQIFQGGNGGECMRIGNSELGTVPYYSKIEYNLFERCNGDMEAISVKSSSNSFKANTFRDNRGSLTFRHGNDNIAYGNFFLDGENGLRSYGHDHVIVNNYFGSLFGSGSLTPLVIGSGTVDMDLARSNSEHSRSRNVIVAFNTFYNNQGTYMRIGEDFRPLDPVDIVIAHNILAGNAGTLVNFDEGENVVWSRNILHGSANRGNAPSGGYAYLNPQLTARSDGTYGIGSTSPAIDQASSSTYLVVSTDMDGQIRSGLKDTGSDEYSTSWRKITPLVSSVVGPNYP